jgi:hypothetical protein
MELPWSSTELELSDPQSVDRVSRFRQGDHRAMVDIRITRHTTAPAPANPKTWFELGLGKRARCSQRGA